MRQEFNPENRVRADFEHNISIFARAYSALVALTDWCLGIDVSKWRPGLDVKLAKQAGVRYIFAKVTQGTDIYDSAYEYYRDECKAKSMVFGGFHYWEADADPYKQAKWFYDHAGNDLTLPPVLDVEKYGNEGKLTQEAAAQHILDTLLAIEELFGVKPIIYTSYYMWQYLTGDSPIISGYDVWVANWTNASAPKLPAHVTTWLFWQYTNSFVIPGASQTYDGNRFNGNEGAFEDYVASLNGGNGNGEPHEHEDLDLRITTLEVQMPEIVGRLQKLEEQAIIHHDAIQLNSDEIVALKQVQGATDGRVLLIEEELDRLQSLIHKIGNDLTNYH